MHEIDLTRRMNGSIGRLVATATRIALSDFSSAPAFLTTLKYQKKAAKVRLVHEKKGLHVPPFLIASIATACNLRCKGCYDRAKHEQPHVPGELDAASWKRIFSEARNLGVSFVLVAGGEPLIRRDVVRSCAEYPEIIFPVFSNGLLLDNDWVSWLCSARNVFPVLSIEGDAALTDRRRGEGVHAALTEKLSLLKSATVLYGLSITLTSENFEAVLSGDYAEQLARDGARVFFFVEYVPFDTSIEGLCVTETQKARLPVLLEALRTRIPALFFDFPGDEAAFGGCLASGRGFVHINATGGVESCPFAPYSDRSLQNGSLAETLASPLLARIRNLQETLGHTGGCALFENKEKVEELLGN
jgi:MoaA/NifB/PqqE/SkfB family radical SAM enzyme